MGSQYTIARRADGWVIAVDGVEILTCNRRNVAVQIVQQADRWEDAGESSDGADAANDAGAGRLAACN